MKVINISDKIYDIVCKNPDVIDIMQELGFKDITKPGMINSAGRIMTIEKGAKMKGISLKEIESKFNQHGYIIAKENEK